jgi:pimeloyl-ACP methyl ester carboxylesterase
VTPSILIRARDLSLACLVCAGVATHATAAQDAPSYGPNLETFAYPYPEQWFAFESQGKKLEMAYMDIAPAQPNGRTALLLHGKNFTAAAWEGVIATLASAGFRVIAPDQIGFGKSNKPDSYQFGFHQLAANTHLLLKSLNVTTPVVIGHSTGGMLGIRYALLYPDGVERLILVDPIGLEDWKAKGVPTLTVDQWTEREARTTADSVRAYEQENYYAGTWKAEYGRWSDMYAGMFAGPDKARVTRVTARIDDMIFSQPVVYEFSLLRVPVVLMIGDKDRTAIGKDLVAPDVRKRLGDYPVLGQAAAKAIPGARLIEFAELGHAPFIQDPATFDAALLKALE